MRNLGGKRWPTPALEVRYTRHLPFKFGSMFAITYIMKPMLNTKDIGERIRLERKAQGRSQSWVANLVGCRRQTIADLEAGRNVGISQLVRTTAALGKALAIVDGCAEIAQQDQEPSSVNPAE
jgi:DNA-binding XRE family transcriptional regulator